MSTILDEQIDQELRSFGRRMVEKRIEARDAAEILEEWLATNGPIVVYDPVTGDEQSFQQAKFIL